MTTSTAAPFDRQYQPHFKHVLPKGFRRARNFGFLHPNSKRLMALLHVVLKVVPIPVTAWMKLRPALLCTCCGAPMAMVRRRLAPEKPRASSTVETGARRCKCIASGATGAARAPWMRSPGHLAAIAEKAPVVGVERHGGIDAGTDQDSGQIQRDHGYSSAAGGARYPEGGDHH